MQTFGSQLWDTAFTLQVMLAADMNNEISSTLIKGYDYLKKSQLTENPPGDHMNMFRDITKGGWTFSDQDQGWPVSDCTAESLEVRIMKFIKKKKLVKTFRNDDHDRFTTY